MVVETEMKQIIVDVGMSFPDGEMHGVDILIPDFTYIREIKDKNCCSYYYSWSRRSYWSYAIYLKRCNSYLWNIITFEMIGSKFDEHKMREHRGYLEQFQKNSNKNRKMI